MLYIILKTRHVYHVITNEYYKYYSHVTSHFQLRWTTWAEPSRSPAHSYHGYAHRSKNKNTERQRLLHEFSFLPRHSTLERLVVSSPRTKQQDT